ncbi:hypothetical protein YPPY94_4753, partial [Yersinia pestis PY-94]
MLPSLLAKN